MFLEIVFFFNFFFFCLQQNQGISYNIEIITEIIMNLRARDKEKHHDRADRKYYVGKMIASKNTSPPKYEQQYLSPKHNNDKFAMYQKMLSMGFENAIAFDASHHNATDIQQTIDYAEYAKKYKTLDDDIKVKETQIYDEYNYYDNDYYEEQKQFKLPVLFFVIFLLYIFVFLHQFKVHIAMYIFKKEFVAENERETFLVDSCDYTVFDCNSFKRIDFMLYEYNEWMMNKSKNGKKKSGFYELVTNNYSDVGSLLDDYHHLIYYHDFDQIYRHLHLKCFDDNPAHLTSCKCLVRNHRNRLGQKTASSVYYFNNDPKEMNIEQILDLIHCYFLHSYHLGLILTPNEFIYIHNNDNNNNDKDDSHDDDEDDDDDDDESNMYGDTKKIQNIQKIVNRKRKRIEYLRGTERLLNHNKFLTKIEDNKNKRDLLMNKQIGIQYEYYDKNKQELYVNPKYNSFREEMLNLIPINEWNVLKLRAENMKNKKYSKLLMADDIDNGCRIEEGSIMYIEHLLSIMIYCNFDNIQTDFVQTCLMYKNNENDDDDVDEHKVNENDDGLLLLKKKKHSKFGNLAKRLFESVWCFGANTNSSDIFYHSICKSNDDGSICFSSTLNCISLPLSTSSKVEAVLNYSGSYKKGIILQLKQNGVYSTMKYFDCEWIADFGAEAELLFFGNNIVLGHTFNINSIIAIQTHENNEYGQDYRDYLICLNILDKIFNAGYYFGITDLNHHILDTTVDLLNSELNYDILDHVDHENIPNYISNLIHLYCKNLVLIKINWPDLLHYYSFIASFINYKENVFINLRAIMPIFTNCTKIFIHGGNPSLLSLNHNTMNYIYSYLYEKRTKTNLQTTITLEIIEITSICHSSTLSFKQCIKEYKQRFKNINCDIYIQNQKVNGTPKSLIIQC